MRPPCAQLVAVWWLLLLLFAARAQLGVLAEGEQGRCAVWLHDQLLLLLLLVLLPGLLAWLVNTAGV
jgi:hypothetical protein